MCGCTWISSDEHAERTLDADGDGVLASEDCDDGDAAVHPGAEEVCDGVDQDCDGEVDEDPVDPSTWYTDGDGDGYGDAEAPVQACAQPSGTVADAADCDDAAAAVHPGATETCNEVDDDCDGEIDEDPPTWYADADEDGYGDAGEAWAACAQPSGTVADGTDCDDATAAVHPGAEEVCNEIDDDCDGGVDLGATDASTWYADVDADGWGDPASPAVTCSMPDGHVADATDCDDALASVHPGATEVCNGWDDDCDGGVDVGAVDAPTWYADGDGDGFGDTENTAVECAAPSGFVADATDCDDALAAVHPGAAEVCDGLDDDCDGGVDLGAVDAGIWYADTDGDGWGEALTALEACSAPSGFVDDATDCDDALAAVHPGAAEVCDGLDDDCEGTVDVGATDAPTWYADADDDGYGDALAATVACAAPSGHVADATDCDDALVAVHPGASDACDTLDNDCDGSTDEDAPTWYADADHDGYGDPAAATTACTQPSGTVATATDCDDTDVLTHPGAYERWYDGQDEACDGGSDYDQDGDGHDADTWGGDDFDDTDDSSYPGAIDVIDGVDNDGDGNEDYIELADADWKVYADGGVYSSSRGITAGDFDADGSTDLVIADFGDSTWAELGGALHLFSAPETGTWSIADASATVWGVTSWDCLGWAFASANLDGGTGDDLVASAPMYADPNRVYLLHDPLTADLYRTSLYDYIEGDADQPMLGETLATVGDQTGDGLPDLLVGNPWQDSQTGEVYLFSGAVFGVAGMSSAVARLYGDAAGDQAGSGMASEDVDGDGFGDLLIGAPFAGGSYGALYLVFGAVTADVDLAAGADAQWYGATSGDNVGSIVRGAGDVDGDGRGDILVGTHGAYFGMPSSSAWLILGNVSYPPVALSISSADVTFSRPDSYTLAGSDLAGGGDFDGDGFDDVVVGAIGNVWDHTGVGGAFLLRGAASLPGTVAPTEFDVEWRGEEAESYAGDSLLLGPDFDGDGLADLLVGASKADGTGTDLGAFYLIHGFSW